MQSEMKSEGQLVVWKPLVNVEKESVQTILQQGPNEDAETETHGCGHRKAVIKRELGLVCYNR